MTPTMPAITNAVIMPPPNEDEDVDEAVPFWGGMIVDVGSRAEVTVVVFDILRLRNLAVFSKRVGFGRGEVLYEFLFCGVVKYFCELRVGCASRHSFARLSGRQICHVRRA